MTPQKLTGFNKFVCFVIVTALIILVIGFVTKAWQTNENIPGSGNVGNSTNDTDDNKTNNGTNNTQNNDALDKNDTNSSKDSENDSESSNDYTTVYIHPLTGLVISEERYNTLPQAAVIDTASPLYGISYADIAVEFPIEDGSTRMLVYHSSEETIWKIGALAATKKYISAAADLFGGIIISYGSDDKLSYEIPIENSSLIDISKYKDCFYIENGKYVYTTENMITLAKNKENQLSHQYKNAPYEFYGNVAFVGTGNASTILIPYSDNNETELYYNQKSGKYLYSKSGVPKMDMLTGENVSYKNVFILFADTTTYEKAEGTELVIDVFSSGKGYYASGGKYTEFVWKTDETGALSFLTLSGEKLKVNTGNSYFTYYKSSDISAVTVF